MSADIEDRARNRGPRAPRRSARRGPVGRLLLDGERRPRRGWRLVAYLVVVIAAMGGLGAYGRGSLAANVAAHAASAIAVLAVTYVFRRHVDRRPWRGIGLPPPRWREAAAGFAGGALAVGAVFATAWALGWASVTGSELAERGPGGVAVLLGAGLSMYAASGFVQELAFRGYALQTLADGGSLAGAAVVSSVVFAVLHLTGVPRPLFALALITDVALMAGFFVLTRLHTGALWTAIGFHTAWNWVMDYVLSMDTDAGPDYGHALVHVRLHAPDLLLGRQGGVEWLYVITSAALFAGYWLRTRGRWDGR